MVEPLTQAERDRFAAYLEQEADTARKLMEQMARLNTPKQLLEMHKLEELSFSVVAKRLRNTITEHVGRPSRSG